MSALDRRPRRFFFCHLQKTGGISLIRRVRRHFGDAHMYPNRSDGNVVTAIISVPHLLARWQVRGHEVAFVSGHFPLCARELLGGGFTTLSVLREPVSRTLSYLRHHRRLTLADRDKPLEAIYENRFRFHGLIHNHMVKMLSLTPEEMTAGALTQVTFTRERFERAKAQLATLDLIGVQERFEEFCADLQRLFGLELGQPIFANRTEPVTVPQSFRERIARDNALDVELYEVARERVAAQRR